MPGKMTSIIDRVPSGIQGFDDLIEGGFERHSSNLVVGGCGVGKSIFCMEYLYHGATQYKEPGVYVTIEENPKKMIRHYLRLGWDIEKLVDEKMLRVVHVKPREVINFLERRYGEIFNIASEIAAKRLVIDSVTSIEEMFENQSQKKEIFFSLFEGLESMGCTSLLISESPQDVSEYSSNGFLEFMTDSVIVMYSIQKQNLRQNALEILKMRGTNHQKKIVPYKIDNGIVVFPFEEIFLK